MKKVKINPGMKNQNVFMYAKKRKKNPCKVFTEFMLPIFKIIIQHEQIRLGLQMQVRINTG